MQTWNCHWLVYFNFYGSYGITLGYASDSCVFRCLLCSPYFTAFLVSTSEARVHFVVSVRTLLLQI